MPLIVETGAGIINANSYATESVLETYAEERALTLATGDAEAALIRGTQYVDTYRDRFPGYRTKRRLQGLEWPRAGAYTYISSTGRELYWGSNQLQHHTPYYDQGYDWIASDVVPIEIIRATCEAAIRELVQPGSMQPDLDRGGRIHSLSAGSVSVVYQGSAPPYATTIIIDSILAPVLMGGDGSGFVGTMSRG